MRTVSILFIALLLSCSFTTFSQGISQQLGADIDGEAANDWSGQSVSMNAAGDRLAIGAPLNGIGIAGHVRIYDWDGAAWMQLGTDIEGDSLDQSGHSVSMNSEGDRLAIGGIGGAGRTRIFDWNGSDWIQLGADIDGEAAGDQSGYSVSMNAEGDRLAIGARFNDEGGNGSGHVRIYDWDGTAWTQVGTDIDGESGADRCGHSVSMNAIGDRLAIGEPGGGIGAPGRTRIFDWNGTAWIQLGAGIDGDESNEDSGWSVSMNVTGDRLAIGTPQGIGNDIGYVRIYDWNGTAWIQVGTDINGTSNSRSGHSVSMNAAGDRLAIGSPNASLGYIGHVRIYDWDGTAWAQYGADIDGEATYDYSGHSVSMNAAGDILAIGAWGNSNEAGHVRIYGECGNTDGGPCHVPGCINVNADNFDPTATVDDGSCIIGGCAYADAANYDMDATYDDGSCNFQCPGCTDPTAFNYNANANTDDGSCIAVVTGCTDATATNYNALANTDDGSCIATIFGCTDGAAFNFDPAANTDNGGCVAVQAGCTNPTANNYAQYANTDDGSCDFTAPCIGDFDQNGSVNGSDLLAFLGVFGTDCP